MYETFKNLKVSKNLSDLLKTLQREGRLDREDLAATIEIEIKPSHVVTAGAETVLKLQYFNFKVHMNP